MKVEKDEERRRRIEERDSAGKDLVARNAKKDGVKAALFALFGEADAQKRGKALEQVLNDLFGVYGISVREAFTVKGKCGEGVIEQIDGLIELEGHNYLVEMKWWKAPIGVGDVSPHLVRIFNRGGQVRGVFISYSEFTEPAIVQCRDAIANGAVMVMASLQELVELINSDRELKVWLKAKVKAAIVDKQPYFKC
jgi:hypothetical protein